MELKSTACPCRVPASDRLSQIIIEKKNCGIVDFFIVASILSAYIYYSI
jgi:hypothetical protein